MPPPDPSLHPTCASLRLSPARELKRWALNEERQIVTRVDHSLIAIAWLSFSFNAIGGEPVRIVATDEGLEAPDTMRAGLRHIVSRIAERRFTRLCSSSCLPG